MKNFRLNTSAFTLIELLVSMTIFSVIMISVIQVYINTTQVGAKTELTRSMQENLKNITEDIANEVRRGRIGASVLVSGSMTCNREDINFFETSGTKPVTRHDEICIGGIEDELTEVITEYHRYALGYKDGNNFRQALSDECSSTFTGPYKNCYLIKKFKNGVWYPISNNLVNLKDLKFTVFPGETAYMTMNFTIEPTKKGGVDARLIENTKIDFQTSFSERFVAIK